MTAGKAHAFFGADPDLPLADGVSDLTAAVFERHYLTANQPVLLRNLCASWPALRLWSATYLAGVTSDRGDVLVAYRSTPDNLPEMNLALIRQGRTSLYELLSECARDPDGPELYVPGLNLAPDDGLDVDISRPGLLDAVAPFGATIFLGRNTKCIGHYHPKAQALLCQVQGRKRVWLFPPTEFARLHLFPPLTAGFFQSRINFYGDRSGFAPFSKARGIMFELHPGDALFIPLHWLHVPEGPGWTVSVTYWWRPRLGEWLRSRGTPRALVGIVGELVRRGTRRLRSDLKIEHGDVE